MNTNDCKTCRNALPDLLLEPGYKAAHPELMAHLKQCVECCTELEELEATFALMDNWAAPDVSPFFDTRLKARLREAVAAEPEGFIERLKARWMYSTNRSFKPALAGALAVAMLAVGGGTFAGVHYGQSKPAAAASATVNDLKILDNNEQALQQMDQLLDSTSDDNSATDSPTT